MVKVNGEHGVTYKRIWKTRGVDLTESFTAKMSHQNNTLYNQPQKLPNI